MPVGKYGFWISLVVISTFGMGVRNCNAADAKIAFDIPSKVECRDVTPEKCAAAHPTMKVIEIKFQISATFIEGKEESISDFLYMISSPDMRLKVLSFLPNTKLESSTAEDRIEVTDSTESSDSTTGDVRVAYSLLSIGAGKNQSNKKTESNHYQRVAPKNLVLASGTVNRGHGVFFKLKPSSDGSLEGVKEFAILCIVPKDWRGDWCTVVCSARSSKKSAAIAKIEHAHVGIYLTGDRRASELADALTHVQVANGGLLSKYLAKEAVQTVDTLHSTPAHQLSKMSTNDWLFRAVKFKSTSKQTSLETAKKTMSEIETQLTELSGSDKTIH